MINISSIKSTSYPLATKTRKSGGPVYTLVNKVFSPLNKYPIKIYENLLYTSLRSKTIFYSGDTMKSFFISVIILLNTTLAFGFENTFFNSDSVPDVVTSVHVEVYDMAKSNIGCSFDVCYRMEVYLNNQLVARWATSPGDPNNDVDFNGVNTPKYTERSLNRARIMGSGYVSSRGDAMPYAMFILGSKGQNTGFAIHSGVVTGQKESHGCIRLEYANAQILNKWVRSAIKNNGPTTITTHDTAD